MNPLKPTARTRTKQDIFRIRHLYVDLDHDGAASLALIQQSQLVPGPNYVLSTSPGKFQVVWTVEDIAQDQAEVLLRAMARKFGGDPAATDSTSGSCVCPALPTKNTWKNSSSKRSGTPSTFIT